MRWLGVLGVCCAAGVVWGQEPDPREVAQAQRDEARARVEAVYEGLEAYGLGAVPPVGRGQARQLGVARLQRPVGAREEPREPAPVPLPEAAQELRRLESLIVRRLNRLDPIGHPLPERAAPVPAAPLVLRFYDVSDLVAKHVDHYGPEVGLGSVGAGGGGGAGGALVFGDAEEEAAAGGFDADTLIEFIEARLGDAVHRGSVEYSGGRLLVRRTEGDHAEVEALLEQLRASVVRLVELEVRLYEMPAARYAALRTRALRLSAEDERGLREGRGGVRLVSSNRVIAHDGQRVFVREGRTESYVADVEVNQTGVVPVLNPVILVMNLGLMAELRPVVHAERGEVWVDAVLSQAQRTLPPERREVHGIELEFPQLALSRTCATSVVALNRGALLGGVLKVSEGDAPLACVLYVKVRELGR